MTASDKPAPPPSDTLIGQFKSFSGVFWVSGWMELIERFSYYGVRVMLPVFMVAALGEGGPELDQIQKGEIFALWAIVQSFVPILSGGFADRYGYKINIAGATLLKIIGYLIMAACIPLAEMLAGGRSLAEARAEGSEPGYWVLLSGAMFVAFGTAIFKPGIGGLIASQLDKRNSSLGWSIFYQLVNVGGFLGPLIAGFLSGWNFSYVFYVCSAAVALNFIPLFFFKEPARMATADGEEKPGPLRMLYESLRGLLEPRLFFFTISFAGFWLLTFQLFDILPNFIDDWVDSRRLASWLGTIIGQDTVPKVNGGNLTQEWMILFNSLLISLGTFLMGYFTRKVPTLVTIIIGIMMAIFATYGLGMSMNGWWILGAIGFFSLGEMLSGPGTSRYIVEIAPPGREALYIGFGNFTVGIGWSIGSLVAGHLYETTGDKAVLARRYLTEKLGMAADKVEALPKEDVVPTLAEATGTDTFGAADLLWQTYDPYSMWAIFALIGVVSLTMLIIYNFSVNAANRNPDHTFNIHGHLWVKAFLIPIVIAFFYFNWKHFSLGLVLNAAFFTVMLIISFLPGTKEAFARTGSR
ncbi:MFS transporter [Haloferula sp. A504]|uniref:MFS transporter n=1 Tax=Haloferula sp. A504 TaxID=3373601 RepID=UPI0031BDE949|nr:MFS transporter [Verrucomicrobiaceae bacterium E54]